MEIIIDNKRKIKDIQDVFNNKFPFLKIEFFEKSHTTGNASPKKQLIDSSKTIADCRKTNNIGAIHIVPSKTVSSIEEVFEKDFGLHVQVFRKAGKVWLETTSTDSWTLEKQNEIGQEFSV